VRQSNVIDDVDKIVGRFFDLFHATDLLQSEAQMTHWTPVFGVSAENLKMQVQTVKYS